MSITSINSYNNDVLERFEEMTPQQVDAAKL